MDFLVEAVSLGIDSLVFGVCLNLYLKNQKALKAVQDLTLHDISPGLEDLVKAKGGKIPYIAIRGTVKAIGSPIQSFTLTNVTGVVQKLSVKEHVISRSTAGFWADQKRTIQEIYNCVPFVLHNNDKQVEVFDVLNADILDLEKIVDRFESSNLGFVDHLWSFVTGVRQRGLQTTEDFLREGAVITGIGELISTGRDNASLKLRPPSDGTPFYVTTLAIPSLTERLEQDKRTYRILSIIFASIGIIMAGCATRRWWQERMRRMREEEIQRALERTRKERRQRTREKDLPDSQLCVVCRLNPKEIIILPCGHVCLCEDCNEGILFVCPICKTRIEKKVPAYIC